MEIGVPKEIKDREFRVGLSPASVKALCNADHAVFVQTQAGVGSGFADADYEQMGASIVADAAAAWNRELVVKVKEPLPDEYGFLQKGQILFTYLHLAAAQTLTEQAIDSGITAIAYESVEANGTLPLLIPMSIIAGRLSVQFGAHFLERQQGGSGVLLGGIPGVRSGRVAIVGGGVVGTEAARMAIGMGAQVQILDIDVNRLAYLESLFGARAELLYSTAAEIEAIVPAADLLIGAVLIPGRRAPHLVKRDTIAKMREGSVIVDVAVDQGGCIETIRPTSHSHPTYIEQGVIHYGVPNMPGAVPRTATQALNNSTLPYAIELANYGLKALELNAGLNAAVNVRDRQLVHPAVREVFPDLA
ncbi:alanine dehydrogenase [Synechococcus sp. PCC 7336]|uniref:alanine dehydrogenase n=1 Tax=Synechococcus sp. PCC 7336 TaxID=195250 RepID=UPI000348B62B|nr:alanine dehydrogenase [Synechococcus sp. PCC 7336]